MYILYFGDLSFQLTRYRENHFYFTIDTPSRSNWDEDDDLTPLKKSVWDLPTPSPSRESDPDFSERSFKNSSRRGQDRSIGSKRDPERSHRSDRRYFSLYIQ